jgi:hypothetical protein
MEVSGHLHALLLYPQGKSFWNPLDRRLGGPQSWSGHGVKQKNSQPLLEIEPHHFNEIRAFNVSLQRILTSLTQMETICHITSAITTHAQEDGDRVQ